MFLTERDVLKTKRICKICDAIKLIFEFIRPNSFVCRKCHTNRNVVWMRNKMANDKEYAKIRREKQRIRSKKNYKLKLKNKTI